jgi:signal recognition particle subunit SRP54
MERKLRQNRFTLEDFLDQMAQLKNMGPLQDVLGMFPGVNANALKGATIVEKALPRTEAIILSMTKAERENPSILNSSRKRRIAKGSGMRVEDINRLLKQFDMMQQMIKQMSNPKMMKKAQKAGGRGMFPFM